MGNVKSSKTEKCQKQAVMLSNASFATHEVDTGNQNSAPKGFQRAEGLNSKGRKA
jgi:hypothetical protein